MLWDKILHVYSNLRKMTRNNEIVIHFQETSNKGVISCLIKGGKFCQDTRYNQNTFKRRKNGQIWILVILLAIVIHQHMLKEHWEKMSLPLQTPLRIPQRINTFHKNNPWLSFNLHRSMEKSHPWCINIFRFWY